MITPSDSDFAEVIFGHARFMHISAHHERNFALGTHDAERHFIIPGISGSTAMSATLREWRGLSDHQHEIAKSGDDRSSRMAQQRHRAGTAIAARQRNARRNAENGRHFFRPKGL